MLEPSSSEEEDEEYSPPTTFLQPVQQNGVAAGVRATTPSSVDGGVQRPGAGSPSPSLTSEKTLTGEELLEKQKKDEEDRKERRRRRSGRGRGQARHGE